MQKAAEARESCDHAGGGALAERLNVNVALATMDTRGAANEFFRSYRRVSGIQRVAFGDQAARGATSLCAQHAMHEKVLVALEENHVACAKQIEIPTPNEYLVAAAHPREHIAIQDADGCRALRANLRANGVRVDLRSGRRRRRSRRDSGWRNG